ncbi:hypothetical protein [Alkalihalobacterium chitinilyticum]|uniref:ABC transporter periplasmic binding protein yphF n=1 Tax=Alkalihalobacterium chitinilyticum TaxID=2980103 RepID=A0ABT5V912_9BACI|nr:hypothetical protein [Alkalihalobacterium chitinilyticum]MDE5411936.1 hypothetical protein [Alkalihalobacterium chitinilyticum]
MKNFVGMILMTIGVLLLTGCLYPSEQRVENQVPYPDQLLSVQQAVTQFKEDTGVLPIKNRDIDTPIYQKYPVDFRQLVPRYLQNPPGNSFESGGLYQYVLVNVEDEVEVKLLDLSVMREIQRLQGQLNQYMRKNDLAPIDEMLDTGLFSLQFEKLNYKEPPTVRTPYFGNYLPLLIDNSGQILIDYRMDINMALQEFEHSYTYGDDVRDILVENSPFVPAFSIPYTIDEQGDPVYFMDLVYGRVSN